MVNQKSAFGKALLLTLIVFVIGFAIGYTIENNRTTSVEIALLNSEISLADEQIKLSTIQQLNLTCNESKDSTFEFADRIYQEALKLEEYDSSGKLMNTLTTFHRRYDLLRALLWTEGSKIRQQCPNQFHTIAYFYDYKTENLKKDAQQKMLDRLLLDFKYNYPDQVLLIPIAANLDIESVNLVMKKYDIQECPALVIDETLVIKEAPTFDELKNTVFRDKLTNSTNITSQ